MASKDLVPNENNDDVYRATLRRMENELKRLDKRIEETERLLSRFKERRQALSEMVTPLRATYNRPEND